MVRTHFPDCKILEDDDELAEDVHFASVESDWVLARKIFQNQRIQFSIKSFDPFKKAGEDQILPEFLKNGLGILTLHLKRLFVASFALEYIPKSWRLVKVIYIPKSGRRYESLPKSYRPISLASFLLKTVEGFNC